MFTGDAADMPAGCVALNATSNLDGIERNTNEDIWEMADTLHGLAAAGRSYSKKEKELGLKYNENGLLYCQSLRSVHKPIDHYIRDWMHILVNGGVANTQTYHLFEALKKEHVPVELVQEYSLEVVLPKKYGKVSPTWLEKARFSKKGGEFHSFASYMLCLLPIIMMFLIDCVKPTGKLLEHIECWQLLVDIVGLLKSGADFAVQHLELLAKLIAEHHELYLRIYPGRAVKPKWHHLLHLPETYELLKKVISCFVTERKHKSIKRASLFVFRHLEHTCLASIINEQCEQVLNGHSLFQRSFLVNPSLIEVSPTVSLNRSSRAVLDCGELAFDDIIVDTEDSISRVVCFWQQETTIVAQCTTCETVGAGHVFRHTGSTCFIAGGSIIDAVSYRPLPDGSFRVCLPFRAEL